MVNGLKPKAILSIGVVSLLFGTMLVAGCTNPFMPRQGLGCNFFGNSVSLDRTISFTPSSEDVAHKEEFANATFLIDVVGGTTTSKYRLAFDGATSLNWTPGSKWDLDVKYEGLADVPTTYKEKRKGGSEFWIEVHMENTTGTYWMTRLFFNDTNHIQGKYTADKEGQAKDITLDRAYPGVRTSPQPLMVEVATGEWNFKVGIGAVIACAD